MHAGAESKEKPAKKEWRKNNVDASLADVAARALAVSTSTRE